MPDTSKLAVILAVVCGQNAQAQRAYDDRESEQGDFHRTLKVPKMFLILYASILLLATRAALANMFGLGWVLAPVKRRSETQLPGQRAHYWRGSLGHVHH